MRFKILFIVSFLFNSSFAQDQLKRTELKAGDFYFRIWGWRFIECDKKVTPHYNGYYFSHVGMLTNYNGRLVVIESYDNIADTVSLEKFTTRTQQTIYVGRLKKNINF